MTWLPGWRGVGWYLAGDHWCRLQVDRLAMASGRAKPSAGTSASSSKPLRTCMCVVCNCGAHKCPSRETFKYDAGIQSEYGDRYPNWPVCKRVPLKPSTSTKESGPFVEETTYNVDYGEKDIPHKFVRAPSGRTLDGAMPTGDYSGSMTEYGDHYVKFNCRPREPLKMKEAERQTGPFDGTTTHRTDFQAWPNMQRLSMKPPSTVQDTGGFKGNTTYQVDFWDKSQQRPERVRAARHRLETGPFCDETTYGVGFCPKKIERNPPTKHSATLGPSGAPFEGETTYNSGFRNWKQKPIRGSPLKSSLGGPAGRFDADTTYHIDFTKKPPVDKCPVLMHSKPSHLVDNHLCY